MKKQGIKREKRKESNGKRDEKYLFFFFVLVSLFTLSPFGSFCFYLILSSFFLSLNFALSFIIPPHTRLESSCQPVAGKGENLFLSEMHQDQPTNTKPVPICWWRGGPAAATPTPPPSKWTNILFQSAQLNFSSQTANVNIQICNDTDPANTLWLLLEPVGSPCALPLWFHYLFKDWRTWRVKTVI